MLWSRSRFQLEKGLTPPSFLLDPPQESNPDISRVRGGLRIETVAGMKTGGIEPYRRPAELGPRCIPSAVKGHITE